MTVEDKNNPECTQHSNYTYLHVVNRFSADYPTANEYEKVLLKLWLYNALLESNNMANHSVTTLEVFTDNLKIFDAVSLVKGSAIDISDIGEGTKEYVISLLVANHRG